MSLDSRLRAIERFLPNLTQPSAVDKHRQEREERLNAMLTLVPEDLQESVVDAMEGDPVKYEELSSWLLNPFECWVTSVPDDFYFPRALVLFLLNPPREYWIGHGCELCGLMVPILLTWSNDPDPPPCLTVFKECPACGGKTSYGAGSKKGPKGRAD